MAPPRVARTMRSPRVQAADGERTNTFTLGPDGRALDVQVEVKSPQLPEPARYALTFERQSDP